MTDAEKEAAVKRVVEEEVSPNVVGAEIGGIQAATIRKWVKEKGFKLPAKYKIKSETVKPADK